MYGARSNTAAYLDYPSRSRVPVRDEVHPLRGVGHPAGDLKGDRQVQFSPISRRPSPGTGFTRDLRCPAICNGDPEEIAG